ncbi:hypothetical protein QBC42DRAFT_253074 [Cladorrhinum samala]|uniref:Uncharacterized protein n=1 Tax=Cladorrhinum samala TaxID=585594 RepID=A0AAV9HJA5_9PEZI|nr:hypothetical protein QBC42DRAFT_253074 [Cladorrhinum samala]
MAKPPQEDAAESLRESVPGNPPNLEAAHALTKAQGLSSTSKRTTSSLDVQVSNSPQKRARLAESPGDSKSAASKRLLGLEARVNFDELDASPTTKSLNPMPTLKVESSSQLPDQQLPAGGYLQTVASSELNSPNPVNKNLLPPLQPSEGCSGTGHLPSEASAAQQNFGTSIQSADRETWEIFFSFEETSDTEDGDEQDEERDAHAQPPETAQAYDLNTHASSDPNAEEQDFLGEYFHDSKSTDQKTLSDQVETEDCSDEDFVFDLDEDTQEDHLSNKTEILHKLSLQTGIYLSSLPTTNPFPTSADGKLVVWGQHQGEPEDKWDLNGRLPKCHWYLGRLRGKDAEALKGGGKEAGTGWAGEMGSGMDEMIGTSGNKNGDGIPRIVITTPDGEDYEPLDLRWYENDWDEDEEETDDEDGEMHDLTTPWH